MVGSGVHMATSPDDVESLVSRFLDCQVPRSEWTHNAHLVVGAWHVARFGPDEAVDRLRTGIRRLNESNGLPNSTTDGYHESITRAFVTLLDEFLRAFSTDTSLADCIGALLRSRLARRNVLRTFYTRETLMSARARVEWVEPDVCPLGLNGVD